MSSPSFIPDARSQISSGTFYAKWRSPSNIALVKYWGKYPVQIPANPSLSFTLEESATKTSVQVEEVQGEGIDLQFTYEGKPLPGFASRVQKTLESWQKYFSFLQACRITVDTSNSFPHSAGIASSASAMSALALCLCDIEEQIYGRMDEAYFFRKASFIARLGSGSAARSVYPLAALWGKAEMIDESSDEFAFPVQEIHPVYRGMRDSILIVDPGQKSVSSSAGHGLMEGHPFAEARFRQADKHCRELLEVMKEDELSRFVEITEQEALTLHGLMMSSSPGYVLIKGGTVEIMQRIRQFREQSGVQACFTLDAGPNVHLLYPEADEVETKAFIESELLEFCSNRQVIHDKVGHGPARIN